MQLCGLMPARLIEPANSLTARMPKPRRAGGFYDTPAWRALRLQALCRDNFRCVICHTFIGNPGQARVDHIQRMRDAPHLALEPSNLRTLCPQCDGHSHRERGAGIPYRVEKFVLGHDAQGMPRDRQHLWHR